MHSLETLPCVLWQDTQFAFTGMSTSDVSRLWVAWWHVSQATAACLA